VYFSGIKLSRGKSDKSIIQEQTLNFIKRWSRILNFISPDIQFLVEEAANVNIDYFLQYVERWIEEEDDMYVSKVFVPDLLSNISEKQKCVLNKRMNSWKDKNKKFEDVCIFTIKEIMKDYDLFYSRNICVTDEAYNIIYDIATKKLANVKLYLHGFNDRVIGALIIIDRILSPQRSLNYNVIMNNLNNFTVILNSVKTQWFERRRRENNNSHPLLQLLDNAQSSNNRSATLETSKRSKLLLEHIQKCLISLRKARASAKHYVDGLKDQEGFFQTLSELEISALLSKRYQICPQREVNGKIPDIISKIDNNEIIVELISLQMSIKLKYVGIIKDATNQIKKKIEDKLNEQLYPISQKTNSPIILAVNINSAPDISFEDLEDALHGSRKIVVSFDGQTKGQISTKMVRNMEDAIGLSIVGGERLSAVIIYKRTLNIDTSTVHIEGSLHHNPFASVKLSNEIAEKIRSMIFV
jgi:hypothetical protein